MAEKVWAYKERVCKIESTVKREVMGIGTTKTQAKYIYKIWVDGKP